MDMLDAAAYTTTTGIAKHLLSVSGAHWWVRVSQRFAIQFPIDKKTGWSACDLQQVKILRFTRGPPEASQVETK